MHFTVHAQCASWWWLIICKREKADEPKVRTRKNLRAMVGVKLTPLSSPPPSVPCKLSSFWFNEGRILMHGENIICIKEKWPSAPSTNYRSSYLCSFLFKGKAKLSYFHCQHTTESHLSPETLFTKKRVKIESGESPAHKMKQILERPLDQRQMI